MRERPKRENAFIESCNDVFHFYHIRENGYWRWGWIRSGSPFDRFGGIPGFWDGYCKVFKKDLERECRMSKKVDWKMNVNYFRNAPRSSIL